MLTNSKLLFVAGLAATVLVVAQAPREPDPAPADEASAAEAPVVAQATERTPAPGRAPQEAATPPGSAPASSDAEDEDEDPAEVFVPGEEIPADVAISFPVDI